MSLGLASCMVGDIGDDQRLSEAATHEVYFQAPSGEQVTLGHYDTGTKIFTQETFPEEANYKGFLFTAGETGVLVHGTAASGEQELDLDFDAEMEAFVWLEDPSENAPVPMGFVAVDDRPLDKAGSISSWAFWRTTYSKSGDPERGYYCNYRVYSNSTGFIIQSGRWQIAVWNKCP